MVPYSVTVDLAKGLGVSQGIIVDNGSGGRLDDGFSTNEGKEICLPSDFALHLI